MFSDPKDFPNVRHKDLSVTFESELHEISALANAEAPKVLQVFVPEDVGSVDIETKTGRVAVLSKGDSRLIVNSRFSVLTEADVFI